MALVRARSLAMLGSGLRTSFRPAEVNKPSPTGESIKVSLENRDKSRTG